MDISVGTPVIFTSRVGLTEFLFYKIGEDDNAEFYLIAPATAEVIGALKTQSLSLRGALSQPNYWVLDVSPDNEVRRFWSVRPQEIPPQVLPGYGLALAPSESPVADILEQAIAFFSTRFLGENLSTAAMPFKRFKILIDAAYDSFRKIFPAPVVGHRSLGRSLDFSFLEPKFSSLTIAIDRPYIDVEDTRKYINEAVDQEAVATGFEKNRQDFFDRMAELVKEAEKGEIGKPYAVEHFSTLDQVNEIVPTTSNDIDRVEFRSQSPAITPVTLDGILGDKFRLAHRLAETAPRQITGVVVLINDASGTMVIRDELARQTTCVFTRNEFDQISLSLGDRVRVRGRFKRRKYRDMLEESSLQVL
jgi:hypothetical protein